jgi:hypothetical protein
LNISQKYHDSHKNYKELGLEIENVKVNWGKLPLLMKDYGLDDSEKREIARYMLENKKNSYSFC